MGIYQRFSITVPSSGKHIDNILKILLTFGCLFEWVNIGCNLIDQHLNQILSNYPCFDKVVCPVGYLLPGHKIAYELDNVIYHTSWMMYSIVYLSLRPEPFTMNQLAGTVTLVNSEFNSG